MAPKSLPPIRPSLRCLPLDPPPAILPMSPPVQALNSPITSLSSKVLQLLVRQRQRVCKRLSSLILPTYPWTPRRRAFRRRLGLVQLGSPMPPLLPRLHRLPTFRELENLARRRKINRCSRPTTRNPSPLSVMFRMLPLLAQRVLLLLRQLLVLLPPCWSRLIRAPRLRLDPLVLLLPHRQQLSRRPRPQEARWVGSGGNRTYPLRLVRTHRSMSSRGSR